MTDLFAKAFKVLCKALRGTPLEVAAKDKDRMLKALYLTAHNMSQPKPDPDDPVAYALLMNRSHGKVIQPRTRFKDFIDENLNRLCVLLALMDDVLAFFDQPQPRKVMEDHIKESAGNYMVQMFLAANVLRGNARRFRVRKSVAEVLAHTDVRVPGVNLALPTSFMVIEIPRGLFKIESAWCTGIIVGRETYSASDQIKTSLMVTYVGEAPHHRIVVERIDLDDHPFSDCLDNYEKTLLAPALPVARPTAHTSSARKDSSALLSFVANVILYCTNRASDVVADNQVTIDRLQQQVRKHPKGSKKNDRSKNKLRKAQRSSIYIVGGYFHAKDDNVSKMLGEGRKINVKHLVRGHWKMQTHGTRGQDRKQIFVQPYWRGPELSEVVERKYVV